jgi:hypothetical protein
MEKPMSMGYPTMESAAIAMHELFLSLTKAGFDENQALFILVGLTRD